MDNAHKLYVVAIANLFDNSNEAMLVAATSLKDAAKAGVMAAPGPEGERTEEVKRDTAAWIDANLTEESTLEEIKEFFFDGDILVDVKLLTEDAFNSFVALSRNAISN